MRYPAPMALNRVIAPLFFALVLATIDLSTCHVMKGSVTCLDCHRHHDFSGIKVLVKCDRVKKLAMATTEADGSFKTNLPSDTQTSSPPLNCLAKLLGGPNQLYAFRKNTVSKIVKARDDSSYTISTPLSFSTTCPSSVKGAKYGEFGSSKTVDLPLPPEWGLAPSSYYIPFFPIIGIP
ncbi:hypothetical protein VitviT2T_009120 [Vitis vinifera]|uniref:Pollen Ole e 1 allergen and extensin family protein n=2 Tax=Vitis vinifera TaxID=29760 RepID=A0ABY9C3V5_VITVI|nr:hypothetical protein VitviT2T_009120 [Vitis vinifera]